MPQSGLPAAFSWTLLLHLETFHHLHACRHQHSHKFCSTEMDVEVEPDMGPRTVLRRLKFPVPGIALFGDFCTLVLPLPNTLQICTCWREEVDSSLRWSHLGARRTDPS
ncbi:hypothetical protein CCM_04510 [Cordyceps militaris CM01]|uniref:Secreted protein n=1 Tax=Cordyceps militaris (strain CM01) TaxID=983644 RepID=G3JFE8_CORMM|nr:uncharacterized protein CCM_04510 [Cordyceps militaris CM01]EGX93138.1 hypothetical protein CCM_04510 [Cordyceps militaris CM01]